MPPDEPLRHVAEASPLGMAYQIIASPDGSQRRFSFVGQGCEALNGVSAEAAMADPSALYDLILPEHRKAFLRAEAEALAERRPFDIEVAMRLPDGQVRWRRIASAPRVMGDGSTVWDGLQIDVTERRRIAEELEEQRRRLEMAVEATGLGFWEWDSRTGVITWSERNRELFGVGPTTKITAARYMELVHPEDRERVREAYRAARSQPGGSDFSVEYRAVAEDGQVRRILAHGRVVVDAAGPNLVVGTSLDVTALRAAEEHRDLMMGELAHRSKNGIAVVMSIVKQSARGVDTVADFEALLTARLKSMADSQDLVTEAGGRPVPLAEVVRRALAPFGLGRFDLDLAPGEVMVGGDIAVGVGLLLHEMATNAVKHGALSGAEGRVAVAAPEPGALTWRETGGPVVRPPSRPGFGTRLLEQALRNRGGRVEFAFEPEGFQARTTFPTAD